MAVGEASVFCCGDALVNVTGRKKTFARAGLTAWRLSIARRRPILYRPPRVPAVNDVSFSISVGEVLGLVGENGCGKSTLARLFLQQSDGCVEFDGADLARLPAPVMPPFRRQAQVAFQNVGSSLNPRLSVGSPKGNVPDASALIAIRSNICPQRGALQSSSFRSKAPEGRESWCTNISMRSDRLGLMSSMGPQPIEDFTAIAARQTGG